MLPDSCFKFTPSTPNVFPRFASSLVTCDASSLTWEKSKGFGKTSHLASIKAKNVSAWSSCKWNCHFQTWGLIIFQPISTIDFIRPHRLLPSWHAPLIWRYADARGKMFCFFCWLQSNWTMQSMYGRGKSAGFQTALESKTSEPN